MLGALRTHHYIGDIVISRIVISGVLSPTFYCSFCRDIAYLSFHRGYP